MAMKLKRILALTLALALCAGQLAVPAAASETEPESPPPVVEVTVTPVENGTQTVTTTTEGSASSTTTTTDTTVTDGSGNTVHTVTSQTDSSNPDAGSHTESSSTTVTTTSKNNTHTSENSEWSSITTETSTDLQEGNPSVQTDTEVVTTVNGSENSTVTVDVTPDLTTTTGTLHGQETTDVQSTTTTVTTETGKYLYEETHVDDPETVPLSGSDTTQGEWVNGTPTNNGWEPGTLTPGTGSDLGTPEVSTTKPADVTPDAPGATLVLKPDATWVNNKTVITLEQVSSGKYPKPQSTKDYTVKELKDGSKVIGWEVTWNTTETTASNPVHTENLTPNAEWTQTGSEEIVTVRPSGYQVNPEGTTVGNVTTKVEEILDQNGNFLGYRTTRITVDKSDNADHPVETVSDRPTEFTPGTEEFNGFTLPDRPEESTYTNSNGQVTTVTVSDLIEGEDHVGYTIVTLVHDAGGNLLYKETRNIYGCSSTVRTDVEVDPTLEKKTTYTTVTTTEVEDIYVTQHARTMELVQKQLQQYETTLVTEQDTYQLVTGQDGNLYFLYKGKMYGVKGTNTIKNSYDVASGTRVSMTGYTDADDLRFYNDKVKNENGGTVTIKDYYTDQTFSKDDTNGNGTWRHVGYGLFSDFVLTDSNGKAHTAKQFKIKDGDQIRYVYCVELGAGINAGTYYSPNSYNQGNDNVPPWTNGSGSATGTVQQLRSVAVNGFWGTESGLGSLDAVKELMRRNNLTTEADNLTVGMALAATQAAIWEFAALDPKGSSSAPHFNNDFLTFDDEEGKAPNQATKKAITALRDLLVKLAKDTGTNGEGVAEAITKEAITGSVIEIKDKVTDSRGNAKTDAQGNTLYNTDLSFTMKVSTSSINGDLVLEVTDANGRQIGKYRLAGDPGHSIYDAFTTRIRPDENGTYTLENLQLAENVVVNLNLKGTQHLDDGVYIYKGENNMQDFIGLSQKENHVDLNIRMEFSVEEPTVEHTHTTTTQKRTDSKINVKTDTRIDTKVAERTVTGGQVVTERTHNIQVYGTVTTTRVQEDPTKENRTWEAHWKRYVSPEEENPNGSRIPAEAELLAKPPKTGDLSGLWMILSCLSLVGVFLLNRKQRKGV